MGQPVVHWEITAKDTGRLKTFYHKMFDWAVNDESPVRIRPVDTGTPEGIQGGMAETDGSWPSGALFYVQVDDVRSYLNRAETLGASTLVPPTETETGTIGIFRDPQGVVVGLMQR
jgi:uncharacterized protein